MPIYIVSHLRLKRPHDPKHRVMYVGPLSGQPTQQDFAITDADLSPHIGHKNKSYCELTALHQMAKLHAHAENETVGLVHYRRRFVQGPPWLAQIIRTTQKSALTRPLSNQWLRRHELTTSRAADLLERHDVIVPLHSRLKESVEDRYLQHHVPEDWIQLKDVIAHQFPEYAQAFGDFSKNHRIHHFNMFVAKSDFLQSYSRWLFDVLDQIEARIDLTGRDNFQTRVFGFLAERLFNVYLLKNRHLRVLHLPMVQIFNESVVAD